MYTARWAYKRGTAIHTYHNERRTSFDDHHHNTDVALVSAAHGYRWPLGMHRCRCTCACGGHASIICADPCVAGTGAAAGAHVNGAHWVS